MKSIVTISFILTIVFVQYMGAESFPSDTPVNLMNESNDFLNNNNRTVAESDSGRNRNNYRQWRKDKKWMNKWNKNATIPCSSPEVEELEVDDEKMPCRRRHHHRRHHHHHHRHHHHNNSQTLDTQQPEQSINEQSGRRGFGRSRWTHVTRLPSTTSPLETVGSSLNDVTTSRSRTDEEDDALAL